MAEEEYSRSSAGGEDGDYEENDLDNGADYEGTLDEEESLEPEDYANELKELEDEGEMSIEELRKKYGLPPDGVQEPTEEADGSQPTSSATANEPEVGSSDYFDGEGMDEETDPDEDRDYAPPDPWRKEPRVDPVAYQSTVPQFQQVYTTDVQDSLPIWCPDHQLSDEAIDNYLSAVVKMRVDIGQSRNPKESDVRDDEDALCALYRNGFDVEAAKASFPFSHVNQQIRTVRPDALCFDESEKALFIQALLTIGKDFEAIRKAHFPYRRLGELIDFYYSWKKSESYFAVRRQMTHPHFQHSDLHLLISNQHHYAATDGPTSAVVHLHTDSHPATAAAEKVTESSAWIGAENIASCYSSS